MKCRNEKNHSDCNETDRNSDTWPIRFGKGICYSGFRKGQSPNEGIYPGYDEIMEDLKLLEKDWDYIRLYDVADHGQTVLKVLDNEKIDLKVMLGICLEAEVNNPGCPWGGIHTEEQLLRNRESNMKQIIRLAELANQHQETIIAVSAGNEATVEWNDHMVPVEKVIGYVTHLKANVVQPVTFCENYVPWQEKLRALSDVVDFISMHTYPVWEYCTVDKAMAMTKANYESVRSRNPDVPVVITEAGWTSGSNGQGIPVENVGEEQQLAYIEALMEWSVTEQVTVFVFEAFDEDWKGSWDPMEPEKHWGIYTIDREPKLVVAASL